MVARMPLSTTKSSTSSSYRLLYRGALCLPDSYLTLDGITFCAQIDTPSKSRRSPRTPNGNHDNSLLENPLALALESMRGRPTLRFMGTIKLSDTWMDDRGDILMDIHPTATLTRIYFENTFCLGMCAKNVMEDVLGSQTSKGKEKEAKPLQASDLGVKVALGDTDGPETTYMVIFMRLIKADDTKPTENQLHTVQLVVARLTRPPDPHPRPRLPRPDDPIPRKPPLLLLKTKSKHSGSLTSVIDSGPSHTTRELKRVASAGNALARNPKRQKLGAHGQNGGTHADFKVPEIPLKVGNSKWKGKAHIADTDVFGLKVVNCHDSHVLDEDNGDEEQARANKNAIKKTALDILARTKDPGSGTLVNRSHPDFKEIFQWVYRGASFALRARMKSTFVDLGTVQHLVKCHVEMYVGGHGGIGTSMEPPDTQKRFAAHSEL